MNSRFHSGQLIRSIQPPSHIYKHTQKVSKTLVFPLFNSMNPDQGKKQRKKLMNEKVRRKKRRKKEKEKERKIVRKKNDFFQNAQAWK